MKIRKTINLLLSAIVLVTVMMFPSQAYSEAGHMHQFTEEVKEPTCTEEGYYRVICTVCGALEAPQTVLPKKEHSYGQWKLDIPARCVIIGREVRICSVCSYKEYREIPATGKHLPAIKYNVPATEYSYGETVTVCSDCNIILEKVIYPRIGEIRLKRGFYEYDGKAHKPKVTVRDDKGNSISRENYRLKYEKKPADIGTHYVKVVFKKHYSGEYRLSYKILPPKPAKFKLKAYRNTIRFKYKKCNGIQISYSAEKSFENAMSVSFNGKKSSYVLRDLDSNRRYYVRAREFTVVDGKTYYSKWSKQKSVKTKR